LFPSIKMDWNILLYLIDCCQIEFHAHIIMLTHAATVDAF
jgi:hypothetical protein